MNYFDLNLRQIQSFIVVSHFKSFTRAARVLNLSQPALTKQIGQLEQSLDIRLLDRNTRSVRLTPFGEAIAPEMEEILRRAGEIVEKAKGLSEKRQAELRVGAVPSMSSTILPSAIADFKKRYPDIAVIVKDTVQHSLLTMVRQGEVDFALGSLDHREADLDFTSLVFDRMLAVFPPALSQFRMRSINLKELAEFPLILMERNSSARQQIDEAFRSVGAAPIPAFETSFMATAAGMVKAGLGVAVLPSSALEIGELAGLKYRPINHQGLGIEIGIIEKSGSMRVPAVSRFLRSVRSICKQIQPVRKRG